MKKKILFTLGSCFMLALAGCNNGAKDIRIEETPKTECEKGQSLNVEPECEHNWFDMDGADGEVKATCTTSGTKIKKCSKCGENRPVQVNPLGHNWEEDNTYEGNVKPTCVTPGVQGYKCSRCNETNVVDIKALGHKWVAIGDTYVPKAGDTKFDYWYCENEGCGRRITATKAKLVSLNCKKEPRTIEGHDKNGNVVTYSEPDYIENSDGSVCFYGRAIHNSAQVPNKDTGGGWTNDSVEPVYDENIEGSFLEYKINESNDLNGCKLVARIKPARYMEGMKMFSAPKSDWTPGLKKVGNDVVHYETRYIVTLDGVELVQNLDSEYNVTVTSEEEDWYTFPLLSTFNLPKGEHYLKITMAAGYICNFSWIGFER